jgi:hypothetical protein
MHWMTIEHCTCPRCAIRRTTRLGQSRGGFCFTCKFQWDVPPLPDSVNGQGKHTEG